MVEKHPQNQQLLEISSNIARLASDMNTLTVEMRATRQIVAGMAALQDIDHVDVAQIKLRLDRLERRLGDQK